MILESGSQGTLSGVFSGWAPTAGEMSGNLAFAKEIRASWLGFATNRGACLAHILSLPAFAKLISWQINARPSLQAKRGISKPFRTISPAALP
jgi:hypothetical protein